MIWTNVTWINVAWANVTVESFLDVPRNHFIKIGSVTAEILLTLSFCGGVWVVGVKSFSRKT